MEKLDSSPLHTPTPPINQHQLPRTNCAVTSRGGAAAHGLTDTGRRMLGSACPTPPSALRLGKARQRWAEGQPEAWGRGGERSERRSWAGWAVSAAAAGAGQTAQPLPPGASLSSPRSWRLQNSLSLSATSLLPLRYLPPRPTPAESPRTGAPSAGAAGGGGGWGAVG